MTSLKSPTDKMTKEQLRLENAYLQGKVEVYERIVKKESVEPKPEFGFSGKKKEKNDQHGR